MEWMEENCYWLLWCGVGLCLLLFYLFRRRRLRTFLLGGGSGLGALILLHFYGGVIGFTPTFCPANLLISVFLGIPGVVLLFIVDLIFK